jgi:hypothetical protein
VKNVVFMVVFAVIWGVSAFPTCSAEEVSVEVKGREESLEESVETDQEYGIEGAFGATMIGDKMYYELKAQPLLRFGRLGIGVDITLHWNENDGLRDEDWDDWGDIANVIRFIQWDRKEARPKLYFRVGELNKTRLGHGFIVYRYTNTVQDEEDGKPLDTFKRVIGLELDLNFHKWGMETFLNDVVRPRLWGARPYIRPFILSGAELPILKNTEVGMTFCLESDADPNNKKRRLVVIGGDIGVPIIKGLLTLYYDCARMEDDWGRIKGKDVVWGRAYGVQGQKVFPWVDFSYKLEFRDMEKGFIPSLFNANYELQRRPPGTGLEKSTKGYFGGLDLLISNIIDLRISYEWLMDKEAGEPSLHGDLGVSKDLLKRATGRDIALSFSYDQQNFRRLEFENENTIISGRLEYGVSENVTLVYEMTQTYEKKEDGTLTPIRRSFLTTKVNF